MYCNMSLAEEHDLRAKNIIMPSDLQSLNNYRISQDIELAINPLGDIKNPYMILPVTGTSLQDNLTHR